MFGQPDDQQLTGSAQQAQNPSMLDNVSTQDLQGQSPVQPTQTAQPVSDPQAQNFAQQHPLTTDDPFVSQTPSSTPPADPTPAPVADPMVSAQPAPAPDAPASQPAPAPVFQTEEPATPATNTTDTPEPPAVDHDKLAGMKQEAMSHLEPLVDHIDGSPEETFKTTMMMIQANDNHMLLDKALEAAKGISDDKARAEALLDIINEINYFSQAQNS